jgi:hypothetical protein
MPRLGNGAAQQRAWAEPERGPKFAFPMWPPTAGRKDLLENAV